MNNQQQLKAEIRAVIQHLGLNPVEVRQIIHRLGLPADRSRHTRKDCARLLAVLQVCRHSQVPQSANSPRPPASPQPPPSHNDEPAALDAELAIELADRRYFQANPTLMRLLRRPYPCERCCERCTDVLRERRADGTLAKHVFHQLQEPR